MTELGIDPIQIRTTTGALQVNDTVQLRIHRGHMGTGGRVSGGEWDVTMFVGNVETITGDHDLVTLRPVS